MKVRRTDSAFNENIIYFAPNIGIVKEEWNNSGANGWDLESVIIPGDLDLDGKVDGSDFLLFRDEWGRTDCAISGCLGDLDGDGKVDGSDFLIFRDNWGNVYP